MPQAQKRIPRELLFAAAATCGLLMALAVHIITSRLGLGLASAWREEGVSSLDPLRSALAWWLIAAAGGFGGFASAVLMVDPPRRGRARALVEWVAALAFLILLAGAEHYGTGEVGIGAKASLNAGFAALSLGALTACIGTACALRTPPR